MDQSSNQKNTEIVTRFAPSPTGLLHLGHAYSAKLAHDFARQQGGSFLLRMEDIDQTRCKAEYIDQIIDDLQWLGLTWDGEVRRQSDHFDDYREALARLEEKNLLYPCFCSRKEIKEEISRSAHAPHGPEGHLYPGTCRALSGSERARKIADGESFALRLDMASALTGLHGPLTWHDRKKGTQTATPEILGDVVLARKETPASYHLSVVLDDADQKISHVIRGEDLFYATHLHRLLQHLLNLPVPEYFHHPLVVDQSGKRFSKRDQSVTLKHLRDKGHQPADVFALYSLPGIEQ
ncbi:tRNA glutamyl-Q(34) synthetase GluQRS [Emcibacter sp.]|uniref:tRNA glutamyl-Q(34) synthetase GluQRS n=1 Tax=Emcibacter sp. TaxID=1979954 RepID=UPI002AA84082|nr:tRNA glutamyl-Q(34) synthetase GluQRS [Emcibacter sp.]